MQTDQIDILIQKQLSGQISEEETRYLQDWLEANEHNRQHYTQVETIWQAAADIDFGLDTQTDSEWSKLMGQIQQNEQKSPLKIVARQSRPQWWRYAAAAVLLLGFGSLWFFINPTSEKLAQQWEVPYGEQKDIQLPDGTTVTLNAGSQLAIYQGFNKKDRRVKLNGEAYFQVHSDSLRPFVITMQKLAEVKVLGTAFNLSAYAEEAVIALDVAEGKVALNSLQTEKEGIYAAGEAAELDRKSGNIAAANYQPESFAWKNGTLIFNNMPFSLVLQRLERHYDVHIINNSSIKNQPYSSKFEQKTIDQVLEVLKSTFDLNYTKAGREIQLN
ncbi:MAG: anti-sigma factor [Saprospiraceae bacterium]|nr:MAG: anti-sigma factor [Saprospiraceae bacterium]